MRPGEDPASFISSWYTPLTLLSTEMQVHSLGGGVMIAVPKEADAVQLLKETSTLPVDGDRLNAALCSGDAKAAYGTGAHSVEQIVGKEGLDAVWAGAETLIAWRKAQTP